MYYIQAHHNNNLTLSLSSTLNMNISRMWVFSNLVVCVGMVGWSQWYDL